MRERLADSPPRENLLSQENFKGLLDEGFLAQVADGCVKGIAHHLQISPQRVHQIIANDPFASYMRIHRAMAATCPERAQQMADRFNQTHDSLMAENPQPARLTTSDALGKATEEGVDVLKAELDGKPIDVRKRETLEQIKALWAYYGALEVEEALGMEEEHKFSTRARQRPRIA